METGNDRLSLVPALPTALFSDHNYISIKMTAVYINASIHEFLVIVPTKKQYKNDLAMPLR